MKKILLLSSMALSGIMNTNAQTTMIVHGSNCTKFYLIDNGSVQKIYADELWVNENPASGNFGITQSVNLTLTPATDYSPPPHDANPNIYISCFEARNFYNNPQTGFGKGTCGPLKIVGGNPSCDNINQNACGLLWYDSNLGMWITAYSNTGNF